MLCCAVVGSAPLFVWWGEERQLRWQMRIFWRAAEGLCDPLLLFLAQDNHRGASWRHDDDNERKDEVVHVPSLLFTKQYRLVT